MHLNRRTTGHQVKMTRFDRSIHGIRQPHLCGGCLNPIGFADEANA